MEGMEAATDHRGGSQSSFTEEMLQDNDDAVRNRSPKDHGYSKNRWYARVLQRYILDNYGKKYSCERIRQILHVLTREAPSALRERTGRPSRPSKRGSG